MSFRARVTENERDSTSRARGVLGARRYTASELSGSRPAELTVAEDWVRTPQTPGQQAYLERGGPYRGFVYDSYTAVSDTIAPTLDRLFWEDLRRLERRHYRRSAGCARCCAAK
ncbi:MAG: hypothetical protein ACLR4Z_00955 [Butyricicoccaceae bacterium]